MAYIAGINRYQASLLPTMVGDYVEADSSVRVIDAFVENLDVSALGFQRSTPAPTGRPGYDPCDLLKLYLYAYLNEIRSSRRIERECRRNVEVMWLVGKLVPDHKTIADFAVSMAMGSSELAVPSSYSATSKGFLQLALSRSTVRRYVRRQVHCVCSTRRASVKSKRNSISRSLTISTVLTARTAGRSLMPEALSKML